MLGDSVHVFRVVHYVYIQEKAKLKAEEVMREYLEYGAKPYGSSVYLSSSKLHPWIGWYARLPAAHLCPLSAEIPVVMTPPAVMTARIQDSTFRT